VRGGFAEVDATKIVVLAEEAVLLDSRCRRPRVAHHWRGYRPLAAKAVTSVTFERI
jgi:hypothetical protein